MGETCRLHDATSVLKIVLCILASAFDAARWNLHTKARILIRNRIAARFLGCRAHALMREECLMIGIRPILLVRIKSAAPSGRIRNFIPIPYKPRRIAETWNGIMPIVPGHNRVAIGLRTRAGSPKFEFGKPDMETLRASGESERCDTWRNSHNRRSPGLSPRETLLWGREFHDERFLLRLICTRPVCMFTTMQFRCDFAARCD